MCEKANIKSLENLDRALARIKDYINPLKQNSREEIMERVGRQEGAKLNTAVAYSLCSLFYMYLKTQGVNVKNHPVRGQLIRVQEYFKKLKNVTEGKPVDYIGQRKLRIDQQAVNRFVVAGLQGNAEMKKLPPAEGVHTRFEEDGSEEEEDSDEPDTEKGQDYNDSSLPYEKEGDSSHDAQETLKRKSQGTDEQMATYADTAISNDDNGLHLSKKARVDLDQVEGTVQENCANNIDQCKEPLNELQTEPSLQSYTPKKRQKKRRHKKGKGASDFF